MENCVSRKPLFVQVQFGCSYWIGNIQKSPLR